MRSKVESYKPYSHESGTALIAVLIVSCLLGLACISLLTAVGANSRNTTDVLSETKAFYAAESGMQATLNVLRRNVTPNPLLDTTPSAPSSANEISYTRAVDPSTSNVPGESGLPARLSRWITYNYTPNGATYPDRVVVGESPGSYNPNSGAAFSVTVTDPDNSRAHTTFTTQGKFIDPQVTPTPAAQLSVKFQANATNFTTLSFDAAVSTTVNHPASNPGAVITKIGKFRVANTGNGGTIQQTEFEINYNLGSPRVAARTMRGKIQLVSGAWHIKIDTGTYSLEGSAIKLCATSACSTPGVAYSVPLTMPTGPDDWRTTDVWAQITPAEPYRLLLKSTGYGPGGARKQLEAILQRSILNDVSGGAAVQMLGPNAGFTWDPGTSNNVSYSGVDPCNCGISVPSIGVTNQASLDYINAHQPQTPLTPPPALIDDELADWQRDAVSMDGYINELRSSAQDATRYFNVAGGDPPPSNVGYVQDGIGRGITFVDGDFTFGGNGPQGQSGGGTLVVTGKLTLTGNFSFTGLIIVTGADGVLRQGGGNGTITGNLIIAPYAPNNLAAGFLPPKYKITGGGVSHIVYSGNTTQSFQGTSAVSDFVRGIAEK